MSTLLYCVGLLSSFVSSMNIYDLVYLFTRSRISEHMYSSISEHLYTCIYVFMICWVNVFFVRVVSVYSIFVLHDYFAYFVCILVLWMYGGLLLMCMLVLECMYSFDFLHVLMSIFPRYM